MFRHVILGSGDYRGVRTPVTADDFITIRPSPGALDWKRSSGAPPPAFVLDANEPTDCIVAFATDPALFDRVDRRSQDSAYIEDTIRADERWSDASIDGFPVFRSLYVPRNWAAPRDGDRLYYRVHKAPATPFGARHAVFPFVYGTGAAGSRIAELYRPTLSIDALPRVFVDGNALRTAESARPAVFRGLNVSGLNYRRYFHGAPDGCNLPAPPAGSGATAREQFDEFYRRVNALRWDDAVALGDALFDHLKQSGVNVIRVVLNQDWTLRGYRDPRLPWLHKEPQDYLADLDRVIQRAASRQIYVILGLHTLRLVPPEEGSAYGAAQQQAQAETTGSPFDLPTFDAMIDAARRWERVEAYDQPFNAPLPDHDTWLFWSMLASRYAGVDAVWFDLCNEPHPASRLFDAAAVRHYTGVRPPASLSICRKCAWWAARWKQWAMDLEEVIHAINEHAVIFVSGFGGPRWGSSLRAMPLRRNHRLLPNVVYKSHIYWADWGYPCEKGQLWRRYSLDDERGWRFWLKQAGTEQPLGRVAPFFVGEWGIETSQATGRNSAGGRPDPIDAARLEWGRKLVEFFDALARHDEDGNWQGFAGWAAWSAFDSPGVFQQKCPGGPYTDPLAFPLTDFGEQYQAALNRSIAQRPATGVDDH
jgi:Cellulase (glycosyl hydrolase family 5)